MERRRFLFSVLAGSPLLATWCLSQMRRGPTAASETVSLGETSIQIDFAEGALDLGYAAIAARVKDAARAVEVYFGKFPVKKVGLWVVPVADRSGVFGGTTWGGRGGFDGFTRIRIGQHTTAAELAEDWMITHELTHMAFPGMPDEAHWLEEGMATYVEPIARVQAGQRQAKTIWAEMVDGMPKGEPEAGDEGMNRTHTWGRTYWGGALFFLSADVEIRRQTKNKKGLQDALRAIVAAGGNIAQDWTVERAFGVGDAATGVRVLSTTYEKWSLSPVEVDLPKMWKELGVVKVGDGVDFRDGPLAAVREGITKPRAML